MEFLQKLITITGRWKDRKGSIIFHQLRNCVSSIEKYLMFCKWKIPHVWLIRKPLCFSNCEIPHVLSIKKYTCDQIEHVGVTICKCRMKKVHHGEMWIQISAPFCKPGWYVWKANCSTTLDFPFCLHLVATIWKQR